MNEEPTLEDIATITANLPTHLAVAMADEFSQLETLMGPTTITSQSETWVRTAHAVLENMNTRMGNVKQDNKDYSVAEIDLLDKALMVMGWDFRKESRAQFVIRFQMEHQTLAQENRRLRQQN